MNDTPRHRPETSAAPLLLRMGLLTASLAAFVPFGSNLGYLEFGLDPATARFLVPAWYVPLASAFSMLLLAGLAIRSLRRLQPWLATTSMFAVPALIGLLAHMTGRIESPCLWFLLIPIFWISRRGDWRATIVALVQSTITISWLTMGSESDEQWRFVVMLGFTYSIAWSEHRNLARRNRVLKALHASQVMQRTMLKQTVHASENDRRRIAAEIHDGPIQGLTAFGYRLERARLLASRGDVAALSEMLAPLSAQLAHHVGALRGTMSNLRPPVLDERGLADALEDYTVDFSQEHGIACVLAVQLGQRLDPSLELVHYRLVQEALANVARHAGASRIEIMIDDADGVVRTKVHDDGHGFVPRSSHEYVAKGHFGLIGMSERAEMAGGAMTVTSSPGAGTTILTEIPCRILERSA